MATDSNRPNAGLRTLYGEHLLLGAEFGRDGVVERYAAERNAGEEGHVGLSDLTHVPMLLFAGAPAEGYARAAFAGEELAVGSCGFEAVLTGDGSVASVPLLARTGASEYLVLDASVRFDVLEGWLSFVSAIEQNGVVPFEGLVTDDVSASHVVLALWGEGAGRVLGDYLHGQAVPQPGEVVARDLDRFPCIVIHAPAPADNLFLVLVPPVHAVVLWRSLLSFKEVEPRGSIAVDSMLHRRLPWYAKLSETGMLRMTYDELVKSGVVRGDSSYIGARALAKEG